MIQTFSSTIRRKEMDAVLNCMVDEKTGPGELNSRFIQAIKDFTQCDGAVAFRSPSIALSYAIKALDLEKGTSVMISALAPKWQLCAVKELGYTPLILDVDEETGLVNKEIVSEAVKNGGRLLILHETMGIVPDLNSIIECGIPVIEDISASFGASVNNLIPESEGETPPQTKNEIAGSKGIFSILGLEEFDTITGGGGAVLIAPKRKEWIVLKKLTDEAPKTDILPDLNSALALIQLKEFNRNENLRKTIFNIYEQSVKRTKNKTFARILEFSTIWSFPVILNGSLKDAKQYANKKDIELCQAYADSVISALNDEEMQSLKVSKSLFLRTVLFPLYPRLGSESVTKISKILSTLP